LRAAGEIETTQENIQDWFELDEGDLVAIIPFYYFFHQHYLYYKFSVYFFPKLLCFLGGYIFIH
jgi:hypothetical protein